MDAEQNAGTESHVGETSEAEGSHESTTSAQATPTAPDPSELISLLDPDELRNHPAVRKLMDDQAAGLKAAERRRLEKKQTKQDSKPASSGSDATQDVSGILEQLAGMLTERLDEKLGPITQEIEGLRSAKEAEKFDAAYAAHGLPESFKQDAKDLAKLRQPKDLNKFLSDWKKKLHLPGADQQQATQQDLPRTPQGSPSPGSPPNGGQRDLSGVISPWVLSSEEVARARQEGTLVDIANRWRNRNLPNRRKPGAGTR
jgi:hypothetical protein